MRCSNGSSLASRQRDAVSEINMLDQLAREINVRLAKASEITQRGVTRGASIDTAT